jgi:hypothetical protein
MAAEMLSIHDGQQPEPSVGGIARAWEMLVGSGSASSSLEQSEPLRLYVVAGYER